MMNAVAEKMPEKRQAGRFFKGLSLDRVLILFFLAAFNPHLFGGRFPDFLVFYPDALFRGEWWRGLTYAFVHQSIYHLVLDAAAFWILYSGLQQESVKEKMAYAASCSFFSLVFVSFFTPEVHLLGLTGLSGVGHGLMFVSALEMMSTGNQRSFGRLVFGLTLLKVFFEAVTGQMLFHFGLCGIPLVASHAGGAVGGMTAFYAASEIRKRLGNPGNRKV